MVTIFIFGNPLDKIFNEGQKRCAEDGEEKMQRFAEEGRATARAKTRAKFGGPSTARRTIKLSVASVGMTVVCGGWEDGCLWGRWERERRSVWGERFERQG